MQTSRADNYHFFHTIVSLFGLHTFCWKSSNWSLVMPVSLYDNNGVLALLFSIFSVIFFAASAPTHAFLRFLERGTVHDILPKPMVAFP